MGQLGPPSCQGSPAGGGKASPLSSLISPPGRFLQLGMTPRVSLSRPHGLGAEAWRACFPGAVPPCSIKGITPFLRGLPAQAGPAEPLPSRHTRYKLISNVETRHHTWVSQHCGFQANSPFFPSAPWRGRNTDGRLAPQVQRPRCSLTARV